MLENNVEFNDKVSDRVTRLISFIDNESMSENDSDSEMIVVSSFDVALGGITVATTTSENTITSTDD